MKQTQPGSRIVLRLFAASVLVLVSCLDDDVVGPRTEEPIVASVVLSDAVAAGTDVNAPVVSGITDSGSTFISIPTGAIPAGVMARIRNRRNGDTVSSAMIAGGLDPVRVLARIGDTLETSVELAGTASTVEFANVVPSGKAPSVIRTVPPRKKKDVPRNARIVVVFSEPIDKRTLTPGSAKLLRGTIVETGTFRFADATGMRLEFVPTGLLAASTNYALELTQDIRDLDGEPLSAAVRVEFSTGAAIAIASIVTNEAAVVTTVRGPRVFTIDAAYLSDGSFTGTYSIFYPDSDRLSTGIVKCFSVLDGKIAWVGGSSIAVNGQPYARPWDQGWRMVDNGVPESLPPGAPPKRTSRDELTLAGLLDTNSTTGVAALNFCSTTPMSASGTEIFLPTRQIELGDFTIAGATPPPPELAPAGPMSQIVYYAPDQTIQAMNADGSDVRQITAGSNDSDPSWSPDRLRIAFSRKTGNFRSLYVINANRSELRQLTQGATDYAPAWSPTGPSIAFVRGGNIWIANAETGALTQLTSDNSNDVPAWSPDGSQIAFQRGSPWKIWVMQSNGAGLKQLTDSSINIDMYPAWSPDGARIAFERRICVSGNQCAAPSVTVVNTDGSGVRVLTREGHTPAWSPDGKRLAFQDYGIMVVNVSGGGRVFLGQGFRPKWSRVGTVPAGPEPTASMAIAGGNMQKDSVFATLATPLSVRVTRDGSPVAGARVNWLLTGAGPAPLQRLNTHFTTTDSNGVAWVRLTLGPKVGLYRLRADLIDGTGLSDGIEFTVFATAGRPVSLLPNTGQEFTALTNSLLSHSVAAFDAYKNPVTGVKVEWTVSSGGGTIVPLSDTTRYEDGYSQPVSRAAHVTGSDEGSFEIKAKVPSIGPFAEVSWKMFLVTKMVGVEVWKNDDEFGFSPDTVEIPVGRTVMWQWDYGSMSYSHDITFEDDSLPPTSHPLTDLSPNTHKRTFAGPPRTIRYRCTMHSTDYAHGEVGVVIVR